MAKAVAGPAASACSVTGLAARAASCACVGFAMTDSVRHVAAPGAVASAPLQPTSRSASAGAAPVVTPSSEGSEGRAVLEAVVEEPARLRPPGALARPNVTMAVVEAEVRRSPGSVRMGGSSTPARKGPSFACSSWTRHARLSIRPTSSPCIALRLCSRSTLRRSPRSASRRCSRSIACFSKVTSSALRLCSRSALRSCSRSTACFSKVASRACTLPPRSRKRCLSICQSLSWDWSSSSLRLHIVSTSLAFFACPSSESHRCSTMLHRCSISLAFFA
mmetsp:Transcript_28268/g.71467  ORF Transcript_28268/g.71467 Transcript_28268/m.71467 type:complete len:277 (-) Transcript_28268:362-1192(-)